LRTLSVLCNDLLTAENILSYIRKFPTWELTVTSTLNGASKPYYQAWSGTGPKVLPDTWSDSEIGDFHLMQEGTLLVSAELKEQDYEEIISLIASRSIDRTPQVDQVG